MRGTGFRCAVLLSVGALVPAAAQGSLERALASIETASIRADVEFIAADELEGRDSPSRGLRLAALYIRARLTRAGLSPAGDDGYFHRYAVTRRWLEPGSGAFLSYGDGEASLSFGEDYYFLGDGFRALDVTGEIAFGGDGTELDTLDLAGRWVLVLREEGGWHESLRAATTAGAVGLLVGNAPHAAFAQAIAAQELRAIDRAPGPPVTFLTPRQTEQLFPGGAPLPGELLGATLRERRVVEPSAFEQLDNVAGLWPGADPDLREEVLVVTVHYDHIGTDGELVFNGANDNGSGVCALLALAEALRVHGPLRRSVLLLWLSGEEKGLLGSLAWTRAPILPDDYRVVGDVNVDGVGRGAPGELFVTPTEGHAAFNPISAAAHVLAGEEGFDTLESADASWQRSDQFNFATQLGVPVAAFLGASRAADYHEPTDTADKIDADKIRRVARLVLRMLVALDGEEL